jgi:choline dehydrogenase-like flavoprotein
VTKSLTHIYDAVVIGAGYIGCSVAYHLTAAGLRTALLDRGGVAAGAQNINEVKGLTRAGMGNCQGPICGELIAPRAMANETDASKAYNERIEAVGALTTRPPIHPLLLSALAEAVEGA